MLNNSKRSTIALKLLAYKHFQRFLRGLTPKRSPSPPPLLPPLKSPENRSTTATNPDRPSWFPSFCVFLFLLGYSALIVFGMFVGLTCLNGYQWKRSKPLECKQYAPIQHYYFVSQNRDRTFCDRCSRLCFVRRFRSAYSSQPQGLKTRCRLSPHVRTRS